MRAAHPGLFPGFPGGGSWTGKELSITSGLSDYACYSPSLSEPLHEALTFTLGDTGEAAAKSQRSFQNPDCLMQKTGSLPPCTRFFSFTIYYSSSTGCCCDDQGCHKPGVMLAHAAKLFTKVCTPSALVLVHMLNRGSQSKLRPPSSSHRVH